MLIEPIKNEGSPAICLWRVNRIRILPRIIKEVTLDQLRDFFVKQVEKLMEGNFQEQI